MSPPAGACRASKRRLSAMRARGKEGARKRGGKPRGSAPGRARSARKYIAEELSAPVEDGGGGPRVSAVEGAPVYQDKSQRRRPPPPCFAWSPSPVPLRGTGEDKSPRPLLHHAIDRRRRAATKRGNDPPPSKTGEGDRASARWRGLRSIRINPNRRRPPPPCFAWSPSPVPLRFTGEDKSPPPLLRHAIDRRRRAATKRGNDPPPSKTGYLFSALSALSLRGVGRRDSR